MEEENKTPEESAIVFKKSLKKEKTMKQPKLMRKTIFWLILWRQTTERKKV